MIPQEYLLTSTGERLRSALVESDQQFFLLLGDGGSGKTALLQFLANDLSNAQQLVLLVPLSQVETVDRLVSVIIRILLNELDHSAISPPTLDEITKLSARLVGSARSDPLAVLPRIFELIKNDMIFPRLPVLMLDGLDEIREPDRVGLLVERLVRVKHLSMKIVLASRQNVETERLLQSSLFQTFTLTGLTQQESEWLLRLLLSEQQLSPELARSLASSTGGNPLLLRKLASVFNDTEFPDLTALTDQVLAHYVDAAVDLVVTRSEIGNDARLLLILVAIFHPISVSSLVEMSKLNIESVRKVIDIGMTSSLIRVEGRNVGLVHRSLSAQIIPAYVTSREINFGELQFGDEAAERDQLLELSFMPRVDLQQVYSGQKNIVLGDRGAGKSAIFQQLQRPTKKQSNNVSPPFDAIVASAPSPANFLQQVTTDSQVSSAEKFKALWLLYSAVLAAREIHPLIGSATIDERRFVREARTILRQIGRPEWIRGEGRLSRGWTKLRSILPAKVKFSVGPVTVEPNWTDTSRGSGAGGQVQIEKFLQRADEMLRLLDRHFLLVFDQIDEAYKYQRDVQESLIQGLFLAEAYLGLKKYIRLVVLLRTDLFEIYDIQEKNKFVSRTIRLSWSWPDLIALLLRRLYSNKALEQIITAVGGASPEYQNLQLRIAFPPEVEGVPFSQWLREGLRNGNNGVSPRQIILFLNLTRDSVRISTGRPEIPLFTEADVTNALTQLSELSYQEVISDFRVATAFVRSCRSGKIATFELSKVESLFDTKEGTVPLQVERLERLGFLERLVVPEGDELISRFQIPPLFTRCWEGTVQ